MNEAQASGKIGEELQAVEDDWVRAANLKTYPDAVHDLIKASSHPQKEKVAEDWMIKSFKLSNEQARALAKTYGVDIYWDWDSPRAREGFYRCQGGTKFCIARSAAYAPYSDLLWMESAKPIYNQAKEFSDGVLKVHPRIMLSYNLSPSFNWDAAGMTDDQIKSFISDIGKLGYTWQFITLAGVFHSFSQLPSLII